MSSEALSFLIYIANYQAVQRIHQLKLRNYYIEHCTMFVKFFNADAMNSLYVIHRTNDESASNILIIILFRNNVNRGNTPIQHKYLRNRNRWFFFATFLAFFRNDAKISYDNESFVLNYWKKRDEVRKFLILTLYAERIYVIMKSSSIRFVFLHVIYSILPWGYTCCRSDRPNRSQGWRKKTAKARGTWRARL